MTNSPVDERELTERQWTDGSYEVLARAFLPMAASLVDATDVGPDDRVLDVACGTGNVSITAYRRGATVTGVDFTPAMLEKATAEAAIIDADIDWQLGDCTDLVFEDDAFDVTLSSVGHIFAPDADAAAAEMMRVTRPGGRIGYSAWTPDSAIAALVQTIDRFLPDTPNDDPSPLDWSDPAVASDRFGEGISSLRTQTQTVAYPALSPAHFWESLCTNSGVLIVSLEHVDPDEHAALTAAAIAALTPYFDDATNTMPLEYRLVLAEHA